MIFETKLLKKVQQAIDRGDLDFLASLIKPSKPRKRVRPVRSALMVSAHRAKHLNKLDELQADVAIINLEDGVAPELKRPALYAAALFISNAPQNTPLLVVRVNSLKESGEEEIKLLNKVFPDAIRIPKVRSQEDIDKAHELVNEAIDIHISVETKEAFATLGNFKGERLKAAYLGILDLLSDLGISQSVLKIANPTIDYILAKFLVDAKTARVLPISFVYQEYRDLEGFRDWCSYEKAMGYGAKGCISPDQVKIANEIFEVSKELVMRARYIKERFEAMAKKGITGFSDDQYGFIDEPIYKDALNVLKSLR